VPLLGAAVAPPVDLAAQGPDGDRLGVTGLLDLTLSDEVEQVAG
jgi:hypothetical protein